MKKVLSVLLLTLLPASCPERLAQSNARAAAPLPRRQPSSNATSRRAHRRRASCSIR